MKYVSGSTSYECSKKYVPSQPTMRTKTDEMAAVLIKNIKNKWNSWKF